MDTLGVQLCLSHY